MLNLRQTIQMVGFLMIMNYVTQGLRNLQVT